MMKDSINAYNGIDDIDLGFDDIDIYETPDTDGHDTGKYFAERFNSAVNGYAGKVEIDDRASLGRILR